MAAISRPARQAIRSIVLTSDFFFAPKMDSKVRSKARKSWLLLEKEFTGLLHLRIEFGSAETEILGFLEENARPWGLKRMELVRPKENPRFLGANAVPTRQQPSSSDGDLIKFCLPRSANYTEKDRQRLLSALQSSNVDRWGPGNPSLVLTRTRSTPASFDEYGRLVGKNYPKLEQKRRIVAIIDYSRRNATGTDECLAAMRCSWYQPKWVNFRWISHEELKREEDGVIS